MNIEQMSRHDLEEYAQFLLNEIESIVSKYATLPKIKHTLTQVEHELYRRDREALGVDND
jgi:hypothetical protein